MPTYEDYLQKKRQLRQDKPPAEPPDLFRRDVTLLLDTLA